MELSDEEKTNGLFAAAKLEKLDLVIRWISLGADPLAVNSNRLGENMLLTLYEALNYYSTPERIIEITEYVLNLPEYKELSVRSLNVYHSFLLNISERYAVQQRNASLMLRMVFRSQELNELEFVCSQWRSFRPFSGIMMPGTMGTTTMFNPGTLFVYNSLPSNLQSKTPTNLIKNLMEDGLTMKETPGCVTLLTVLMLRRNLNPEKVKELIDYTLKEINVNVESCTDNGLISDNMSNNEDLVAKRLEWLVPDVVMLSFLCPRESFPRTQETDLLQKFLPHWWGPPLALAYFITDSLRYYDSKLLSQLKSYGGIPHGTDMFRRMSLKMRSLGESGTTNAIELVSSFSAFAATPMRLTDLAKYAVRHLFAKRAAQPDTNLPLLLKLNLPPLLYTVCTQQYGVEKSEEKEESG